MRTETVPMTGHGAKNHLLAETKNPAEAGSFIS